jgi:DNA adenine methylase
VGPAWEALKRLVRGHAASLQPTPQILKYPGSDFKILDRVLAAIEREGAGMAGFVEVFGGSGITTYSVASRQTFRVTVYNELNDLIVDTFTAIRESPDEVAARLMLMPCSRSWWQRVRDAVYTMEILQWNKYERAAAVILFHRLSYGGVTGGRKSAFMRPYIYDSGRVRSCCLDMQGVAATIYEWARAWRAVTIEHADFRHAIELYDSAATLFYCDPPYIHPRHRKYYLHGFSEGDMRELLELLGGIRGRFVLKLTADMLEYDFVRRFVRRHRVERAAYASTVHRGRSRGERREILLVSGPRR